MLSPLWVFLDILTRNSSADIATYADFNDIQSGATALYG